MDEYLKIAVFLALLIIFIIWVFCIIAKKKKEWQQIACEIASSFGCQEGVKHDTWTQEQMLYEWEMKGCKITVSGGAQTVKAGNTYTMLTKGSVIATYRRPLPFPVSIQQGRNKITGDSEFDRACAVHTDQPDMIRNFLSDPSLREAIRKLVKSMTRNVKITHEAITVQFFEIKEFKEKAMDAIDLAERISISAERL